VKIKWIVFVREYIKKSQKLGAFNQFIINIEEATP